MDEFVEIRGEGGLAVRAGQDARPRRPAGPVERTPASEEAADLEERGILEALSGTSRAARAAP